MRKHFFLLTLMSISLLTLIIYSSIASPIIFPINKKPPIDVNIHRIAADVQALATTPQPRNAENMSSLNLAADYIKEEWSKVSHRVQEQVFTVSGKSFRNIICSFGPKDGARIVVGAHYDVCHEQAGADDNASGVAGLLELARILHQQQPALKYRIDLVAYTLEEPPYFRTKHMGSYVHAKSLYDQQIPVKQMICLEMIGYFSDEKHSQDYPVGLLHLFYPEKGNFITVVGKFGQGNSIKQFKKGMLASSEIPVKSIKAPASLPGIDFSDHLNYWHFGYQAIMITNTAFYRNKNYHQPSDTPETLNYTKMAEVIKGVYGALIQLD